MKRKIYAVLGDFYHKHDLILRSLQEAVKELEDEVEVFDLSIDEFPERMKDKPDIIIMDRENRINPQDEVINKWMTPEIEKTIVNYVSEGGSFLAWHAGLASYNETGDFVKMLKGYFRFHPSQNKPVRYYTDNSKACPDCLQLNFEVMDEHYFVKVEEENTEVFLWADSEDGKDFAGWKHPFGKGRVCCITPTHREEGLLHPEMLKLLRYAINWCTEE